MRNLEGKDDFTKSYFDCQREFIQEKLRKIEEINEYIVTTCEDEGISQEDESKVKDEEEELTYVVSIQNRIADLVSKIDTDPLIPQANPALPLNVDPLVAALGRVANPVRVKLNQPFYSGLVLSLIHI
mgnify:CR=1 FL=1